MAILDVIKYGHPNLRKIAEPVKDLNDLDPQFIQDLLETMRERDGVGLAATQVDVMKRVVVVYDYENTYILINPEIVAHSESQENGNEGCLSLPGLQASVPRYEKIVVHAINEKGQAVEITARGVTAIIMQHEIDHLNGTLYIDRADLSTLEWLENEDEGLEKMPANEPATLDQVQQVYKKVLYDGQDDLVFEPQDK